MQIAELNQWSWYRAYKFFYKVKICYLIKQQKVEVEYY